VGVARGEIVGVGVAPVMLKPELSLAPNNLELPAKLAVNVVTPVVAGVSMHCAEP
jgi:hypothetical protein